MQNPVFAPGSYTSYLAERTYGIYRFRATTPQELKLWQIEFRRTLREALGLHHIAEMGECELDPELLATREMEDHILEEWTVQTEPGFRVPFYLLRPLQQDGPLPLVITPHGHERYCRHAAAGLQLEGEGDEDMARQAVREGYIAIAPDVRAFGSLRTQSDIDRDARNSCRYLSVRAMLFGRTLIGERVWDIGRLISYAARVKRSTSKIVVTGNSGGGTVTLFTAACDERIKIAIPSSYFCTFEHSIGTINHCECNYVPGIMRLGEMSDVAGLIAPRPFMAVNGKEDPIYPYEATRRAFAALQKIYRVAGVPDRCRLSTGNEGHRYYKKDVWPFVREWIGKDIRVDW